MWRRIYQRSDEVPTFQLTVDMDAVGGERLFFDVAAERRVWGKEK
jgi:hypothetical protein